MIEMPAFDLFNLCCANSQPCPFLKPVTPPSNPFLFLIPFLQSPNMSEVPQEMLRPHHIPAFVNRQKAVMKVLV